MHPLDNSTSLTSANCCEQQMNISSFRAFFFAYTKLWKQLVSTGCMKLLKKFEVIQETGENLKSQQIQQHKIPLTAECVPKQAQNKFG